MKTETLRQQHKELFELASQLKDSLVPQQLKKDPEPVKWILSELSSKLRLHLVMEDEILYPAIADHSDEQFRALAQTFMHEMGGLHKDFTHYITKWLLLGHIQEKPEEFIDKTNEILDELIARINKEDKRLYPIYDEL